ncbi:MAG: acyltransferase [Ruminococcus sp.]|uniref:acyltransferase family protein n=1 Tax=Ruminococcus sp. TaxID=41978 RepID=UPI002873916E|nr:acyltransferase [Ruminococcus sp.]MBQ3284611.1 acyltransferase [Ruminococcus sp.]
MASSKKMFNLFTISEARNVLFGIATLWIGLFHSDFLTMAQYTDNKFIIDVFGAFRGMGNIGVDMFLFLSGVGLFFSFTKDNRFGRFLKKRFMRVLPTALLIGIFYFSFRYATGRYTSGLKHYLSRISFTYFFAKGERVFWFISLILVLYLVFPIFFKIIERFRLWGMLGIIAVVVAATFALRFIAPGFYRYWEIALCRVPSFVIGIWAGKFVMEKKEINRKWLWLFLGLAVGLTALLNSYTPIMKALIPGYSKDIEPMYIFFYRYVGAALGIVLVVLLSFVCTSLRHKGRGNLLRNFFEFVGMYSMEYYMIYLNINHYIERVYNTKPEHYVMLYFGSFVVSLVLCVLVRKVCDIFMAYMQRKPANLQELREARKKRKLKTED